MGALAQAKLRLAEGQVQLRLARQGVLGTPRLELLCQQLGLDTFQKQVVMHLALLRVKCSDPACFPSVSSARRAAQVLLIACGAVISPVVKQLLAQSSSGKVWETEELTVGRILEVFTTSFHEQASGCAHTAHERREN